MSGKTKKTSEKNTVKQNNGLPKKRLFRVNEVANFFDVTDRTVYLWYLSP